LFYIIYNFSFHSLKQNFFSKQKQSKLSERGKVLPDDFGENFKVFLSFNSIPIPEMPAIAEKFIGDQDEGHRVELPVRACEKLAPILGGIKVR
jgi:hypothetical protein